MKEILWSGLVNLEYLKKCKINAMKRFLISPVILPKLLIRVRVLNPGRPGASPTRYLKTISLITYLLSIYHLNMLRLILLIHSKDRRLYCQAVSRFFLMFTVFPH